MRTVLLVPPTLQGSENQGTEVFRNLPKARFFNVITIDILG